MKTLFLIATFLTLPAFSYAKTAEEKGLDYARVMQEANEGFVGEKSDMEMILIDAQGNKVTRKMDGLVKEQKEDGDMSISIFKNPRDVKGTKMLTHSHKTTDDDQWLYLPTLRRVKRISSSNKSGSFLGSEFSYEDLGSQEVEKYNFKWVKEGKTKGGDKIVVLERVPKTKSGYSKQVLYVNDKIKNPIKIEYFDRKGELLKVAKMSNYQKYTINGKTLFRAAQIHMDNVQTKKQSIFKWSNREVGVNLGNHLFEKTNLKK